MAKGKKTGGRKRGTKNKVNRVAELRKAVEASGMTPLEFMLEVMRDETVPLELRCEMAKASAPYLHARRAPEDRQGKTVPPMGDLRSP
jgi:hypothetical protein